MPQEAPRVLISDKLSSKAVQIFKDRGIVVDDYPDLGKNSAQILNIIEHYDGLAIRSTTKVSADLVMAAKRLKVVGRAGIGVDNVDLPSASRKGILVMNTPFGNSITTAEHAIALMFALARDIPAANFSTHEGKWEKNRFIGVEITGKTLGILGCGNVGSLVAARGNALGMKVIACDPFLTEDRAKELGVRKVDFDFLLAHSDFLTLHTPLSDKTRNIINKKTLSFMKNGARIINCARGELVVEEDLAKALCSGKISGAAVDVFEKEPARTSPLFGLETVICTPHLGASTLEAQENVALQIATQISDYLLEGIVSHAVNMPSISPFEVPRLKSFAGLAEVLGSFLGQLVEEPPIEIEVLFDGLAGDMNTSVLVSAALSGFLKTRLENVNGISAPFIAKDRGILVSEIKRDKSFAFDRCIRVSVKTASGTRSIVGTCHSDGRPRFIQIDEVCFDALVGENMLYMLNKDVPGIIGMLGVVCGAYNVNIAHFHLGRDYPGGCAVALLSLDAALPSRALDELTKSSSITSVKTLHFNHTVL